MRRADGQTGMTGNRTSPQMSRRQWLAVTAGAGLGLALPQSAAAQAIDRRTPSELDHDWLKATEKYAPERARRLAIAGKGAADGPFRPDWRSLQHYRTPDWYADAKFGIFIHWGLYSLPAFGSEWYSRNMYVKGSPEYAHHLATYGSHTKFGYKDFIPKFKAEQFDPAAWTGLFRDAGARYIVPVAEHHDGFSMYDTHLSDYSAVKMGPKRDIVADLKAAAKSHDLHFCLSSHRAEHDWFFDEGRKIPSDVSDPTHAGLYGPAQSRIVGPNSDELFSDYTYVSQYWLDDWLARQAELVERYSPDLIYFDWWIGQPSFRNTLPKFLAYYYNFAARRGGSAVVNYKLGEFADGAGTLDIERGQAADIRKDVWQTCTSISDKSWGYIENDTYKSVEQIVHLLADVVSKNGNLLLNVGPHASGDIPEAARDTLLAVGGWLKVNGEAIYGSRPWRVFGEGPTDPANGSFAESKAKPYTPRDFRFTTKADLLYAIQLGQPDDKGVTLASIQSSTAVKRVTLLGSNEPVRFEQTGAGLVLYAPGGAPRQPATVYRIEI
jgi:alpha-L-fucosidase